MKKYLLFIVTLLIFTAFMGVNQTSALMACDTGEPTIYGGNKIISVTPTFCCEIYSAYNPSCNVTSTPPPTCTIPNGTGKFITNYANKWVAYGETQASDIAWVPVCDPMPTVGDSCTKTKANESCKKDFTTKGYLSCEQYDTGNTSCVVDKCDSGYEISGNTCIAITTPPIIVIPPVETTPTCSTVKYQCTSGTPYGEIDSTSAWTWNCRNTISDTNCSIDKPVTLPITTLIVPGGTWGTTAASSNLINNITSGIKSSSYQLTWCPSQISQIGGLVNNCKTQQFSDESGIATLLVDGGINSASTIADNMAFKIIGEGKLTIQTFISDNANNIAKKEYVYLVDKTAPEIGDITFIESSQYVHAEETENISINLKRNQAVSPYIDTLPALNKYIDLAIVKNKISTENIQKVRYKNIANQNINIILNNANDDYSQLSTEISELDKIEYLDGGNLLKTDFTPVDGVNIKSRDFGNNPDTGKNINVRLYDKAGNYSEKAFYVYRDETKPDLNKFVFDFQGDTNGLLESGKLDSRFILANTGTKIKYDWGLMNDHMAIGITMKVEDIDNTGLNQIINLSSSTGGTSNPNINLKRVDNNIETGNYRNYSIEFETPGITGNNICDAVGNCVDGSTVLENFRVMAAKIDNSKSQLSIQQPARGKAIANNPNNPLVDKYSIGYKLEDQFNNSIRQVTTGGIQIKEIKSDFKFTNGLTGQQTPRSSDSVNNKAVTLSGSEITDISKINKPGNNIELKESNNSSNGIFSLDISSKIPTVGGYKYMKNNSTLSLDIITNNVVYTGSSYVYSAINENEIIDYTGGPTNWLTLNSNIFEEKSKRYNIASGSLDNYGNITSTNYTGNLTQNTEVLNFEFGAPFIYYAEDLNILRDGINSTHMKFIKKNDSGISNYKIEEKYFDAKNPNSNIRTDFYVTKGSSGPNLQNNFETIGGGTIDLNLYNSQNGNPSANDYKVKYEALQGQDFDTWGYVSYIGYRAGKKDSLGNSIYTYIPSISRGIKSTVNPNEEPSAYFPTVIPGDGTSFLTRDISISGLVNNIEGGANSGVTDQSGLVSLDMKRPYTRAELLLKVKKKVFTLSRGITWCNQTNNPPVISMNPSTGGCTIEVQGEKISFYKGDIEIPNTSVAGRRAIIVKNGRVTIAGNINTKSTGGQLLIVSITDKGLNNIKINTGTNNGDNSLQKGWITIKQGVTNIDAFLLSQGPLVSVGDLSAAVLTNYDADDILLNQLHIYGSVFSLNTIGGSKLTPVKCPYIEENCSDGDTAKVYDLSFLRRYTLVDAGNFGGTAGKDVPYNPTLDYDNNNIDMTNITETIDFSKSSGGYIYDGSAYKNFNNKTDGDLGYVSSGLRETTQSNAPVIIERDNRWTSNPSIFAKD